MTEPIRVSASQVSRALGCMRRWAWERVDPIPAGPDQQTRLDLGTAVHTCAEEYMREGKAPDRASQAGRAFMAALPFVPAPHTGIAELEISMAEPAFVGYVDLFTNADQVPHWQALVKCEHVILDYKTKDSLKAKSMFEGRGHFLTDPQALTYAEWYMRTHRYATHVGLRWLYVRVNGAPGAKPVDCVLSRADVREAFDRLVRPTAERLVQLRLKGPLEPLTLEPNPLECKRYGERYACPYISRCNLTVQQHMQGAMDMALIDDLRAQFGNKGVNPPEASNTNSKPAQEQEPARVEQVQTTVAPQTPVAKRAAARAKPEPVQAAGTAPAQEARSAFDGYTKDELDEAMVLGLAIKIVLKSLRG